MRLVCPLRWSLSLSPLQRERIGIPTERETERQRGYAKQTTCGLHERQMRMLRDTRGERGSCLGAPSPVGLLLHLSSGVSLLSQPTASI